jgi:hypothetical protein
VRTHLPRLLTWLWLLLLSVLLTWPAARFDALVGHPRCTSGCHAWVIWATRQQLMGGEGLFSELLFFPHGADLIRLYGSDLLGPLLLAPLAGLVAPWALVDLWMILMVLGNGIAAMVLGRGLGLTRGPATVLATAFMAAPFFAHEAFNGTTELLAAWPLPLFALAWLRLLERPGWRLGLLAGLAFGVGGLLSAYTPFFLLLLVGVSLAWWGTTRLEPLLERARLVAMALAGGVGALLLGPVALLHLGHGAGALHSRRVGWSADAVPLPDSAADLLGLVWAGVSEPPRVVLQGDGTLYDYWTLGTVTLGFLALALALVGWWRGRERGPWPMLLVAALLVSLGPWLVAGGALLRVGGSPVPGPALLLERLFPPWAVVSLHPYRFASLTALALAALAGMGAGVIEGWLAARWRWSRLLVAPLLCLGLAGESLLHRPMGWHLPTLEPPASASWTWLAQAPRGGMVLLPFASDEIGDVCQGLLNQTVHGQPWSDGAMHFRSDPASLALYADSELLRALASAQRGDLPGPATSAEGLARLGDLGFRYLVLDRAGYARFERERQSVSQRHDPAAVEAWLLRHLGAPVQDDGVVAVFGVE